MAKGWTGRKPNSARASGQCALGFRLSDRVAFDPVWNEWAAATHLTRLAGDGLAEKPRTGSKQELAKC